MPKHPDLTAPADIGIAGDYRLLRTLGAGGFGVVFEARHRQTDLPYAIKRLQLNEEDADRFLKEVVYPARIANKSLHVLGAHSFFRDDQQRYFYLVMELMPHGDLRRFLDTQPRPLPLALALEVCLGVARGLAAIHDQGIVHRDLKPTNVLMDRKDGRWVPKITDFGLARSTESLSIGDYASPGYAAPEQLDLSSNAGPNADSDAFSLGVLLYEVLTDQRVTAATNLREYCHWLQAREAPPQPSQLRPELTQYPDLDVVVMSLLEFDRSRRLSSAPAVVETLSRVQREVEERERSHRLASALSTTASTPRHEKKPASSRYARIVALTATTLVLAGGLAWLVLRDASIRPSTLSAGAVGLTGCWSYNSLVMTMTADGKVTGFLEGGRWANGGGQKYVITWPRSTDTLLLSADGRSLSGTNNYGGPGVTATRMAGDLNSLAGSWQWSNGQPTVFRSDGSVTNGPIPGRWTRLPDGAIRIVWAFAFVDQLTLADDGRVLSGKNQLGMQVGGTRMPCPPGAEP